MNERALRVAVVGSGPSGFYAVEHLQKRVPELEVDLFDRLPTPYGLVRGGVAPDHPKIKSVTRVYDRLASHPSFRFLGNVTVGKDLSHEELLAHYDAVIYAVGAQTDRQLRIPGEHLAGSHAATEFVGWYNGHPDYRGAKFDLTQESAAIIGLGNVAMDVTRMLASTPEELASTDITDYALNALRESRVRTIYVLGRRGPVQGAFTNPEVKELGELADADVIVRPEELELDPLSAAELAATDDHNPGRNLHTLAEYAARPLGGKSKRIVLRFLVSPVELVGEGRVEGIRVVKNRLVESRKGGIAAEPTEETELLPVGLVFRSVGYRGVALPGVPFDEWGGVIPNRMGRVIAEPGTDHVLPRTYVVGWIKRGPSGVIGTNKPDSAETVDELLLDRAEGRLPPATGEGRAAIDRLLADRNVQVVSFADWKRLDQVEQDRGKPLGKPRQKVTNVHEMLEIVRGTAAS